MKIAEQSRVGHLRGGRETLALTFFVLFGLLALLLIAPVTAQAATLAVTKTTDTADGTCSVADCSLREAVIEANANGEADRIELPPGDYTLTIAGAGEDLGATGDLDLLAGDIEIRGMGSTPAATVIDATGLGDRIFDVVPFADSKIMNLTLRGGSEANGGAIRNDRELTIRGVVFDDNTATGNGGAIYSFGGGARITIEDSTFGGNQANNGGAIYNQDESTIVVARSTFAGNEVIDRGGAIYNQNDAAFTLSDSRLTGNTADNDAGAIFTQNSSSFTILRSSIDGNRATEAGGGIFVQNDSALAIYESTIDDNTALGTTASDGGGAIYANNDSALLIERSTISRNHSDGDAGGISRNNDGQLLMHNSTVSNNSADGNGGGLIFDSFGGGGFIALENTTVAANSASGLGGGIYHEGDPLLEAGFERTIIAANTAAGAANDCATDGAGVFTSNGFNLDSTGTCGLGGGGDIANGNAALGPLQDNGGPTETRALLTGSDAIDAAGAACAAPIDQRGVARPQAAACDIGAFERVPPPEVPVVPDPPVAPDTVVEGSASAKKKQKQKQKGKRIVVKVVVEADESLRAVARGNISPKFKLKRTAKTLADGERKILKLKPKKAKDRKRIGRALRSGKKTVAKVTVKLTDEAGNTETQKMKVRLKR